MEYQSTLRATFLERPNRFIAKVLLNGREETVHVKNTGRCRELLLPHSEVILSRAENKDRKTAYDLIAVKKEGLGLVNIDSQAPNRIMAEYFCEHFDVVHPEYRYGNSRLDFYLEKDSRKYLVEVKGCTLEKDGIGYFPDAPTLRGVKHIHELITAKESGYRTALAFVIQMPKVTEVRPNLSMHKEFYDAWQQAVKAGVTIAFFGCNVLENKLEIDRTRLINHLF